MVSSEKPAHILVFPYPAQGHMLSLLDLTHHLAHRGLTLTILVTPKNLPILNPLLSSNPSIRTLVLPFPDHPSVPAGVQHVGEIGVSGNAPIIAALSRLQDPIVRWFNAQSSPPVALISDFFLGWTHHLAQQLGIPRITYYSVGFFLNSLLYHLFVDLDAFHAKSIVQFPDLPNSPCFSYEKLPTVFKRYNESDPDWAIVRDGFIANVSSWASVFNSSVGLEGEYLDYYRKKMGLPRVFAVGPVNLLDGPGRAGQENPGSGDEVLRWLDGCPNGSVLYVCFGSQKLLKQAQMDALATGLEQSGVPFVWVVKPVPAQQLADGYGSVPDGLEGRVAGRARIIKGWAPQLAILSHRAVGGFLSHCGWNSVLEAITAGVMILGWPMEADQFVNAKLLVEYKRAAVQVCEGADAVPDSTELARKINESMGGDVIERERAKELKDMAIEAVKVGGTSRTDLDDLVQELSQLPNQ